MSIDPMHLPIFGDPRPVRPPAAVRAAASLLVGQAGVTMAAVAYSAAEPTLYAVSVLLTVGFAVSVRAGRDWARAASCLSAFLSLFMTIGLIGGVVDLAAAVVSGVLLVWAARLMFRANVQGYFAHSDPDSA